MGADSSMAIAVGDAMRPEHGGWANVVRPSTLRGPIIEATLAVTPDPFYHRAVPIVKRGAGHRSAGASGRSIGILPAPASGGPRPCEQVTGPILTPAALTELRDALGAEHVCGDAQQLDRIRAANDSWHSAAQR